MKTHDIKQHRVIMTKDLNSHNNLFGGTALKWMDELAFITATKYTNQKMVTVSVDKVRFYKNVEYGDIVELKSSIVDFGRVKIKIKIDFFCNKSLGGLSETASPLIEGEFTLVAVNEKGNPIRISQSTEEK